MFFAKPGVYEASGLYGRGHIILLLITVIGIYVALQHTKFKAKEEVKKIIENVTLALWFLEVVKIAFNFIVGNIGNPNNYIPLYYCSLVLYAGILSSYAKGILKKVGDIFIATGAIIGGICFLMVPNTSLTMYPAFHFISIQSFVFHGSMIYLGILSNITGYVNIAKNDIIYYALFVAIFGIGAYIFNKFLDTNLMFVSKDYPGTPVSIIHALSGNAFPLVMILGYSTTPFYLIYLAKLTKLKNIIALGEGREEEEIIEVHNK